MDQRDQDAEKRRLRARALAARRDLGADARRAASAAACRLLSRLPELAGTGTVAAFAPRPDELDLRPLLEEWLRSGRSVILPRVLRGTRKMTWHKICSLGADLDTGYAGLLEPVSGIPAFDPARAAAVLVPSVAVDRLGNRIGSGGGFYDRNAPEFDGSFVIAPVFCCQLIDACPVQAHDRPVDAIVTEREVVRCR